MRDGVITPPGSEVRLAGLVEAADLVLRLLAVEVVAPAGDEAVGVDLDDGGAVHLDRRLALVGGAADPLEERPVVTAPDPGDLLPPVRKHVTRLLRDVAQVTGAGIGGIGEAGAGCEEALPIALGDHV